MQPRCRELEQDVQNVETSCSARLVGVSRARVTQVMRLLDLAPDIQEAVLDGHLDGPGAEVALRKTADELVWARQSNSLYSA